MSPYSVNQMKRLGDALEAAGFTPNDVTKLRSFAGLRTLKDVLRGSAQIVRVGPVIDLDKDPFLAKGWKVEEHIKGGQFEWNPAKVAFYLSEQQQNGKVIQGNQLREELKGKPVYNANLLTYLFRKPQLIPDEWKGKLVFFWGTIYRSLGGDLCVRYLYWSAGGWHRSYYRLDDVFGDLSPAAVPPGT